MGSAFPDPDSKSTAGGHPAQPAARRAWWYFCVGLLAMCLGTLATTAAGSSLLHELRPDQPDATDGRGYELGMKFESDRGGHITAIRHWRAPSENGVHTGRIWSASGVQLASVRFNGGGSGWQQATLDTPVRVEANTTYVVSVNVNSHYPITRDGLSSAVASGGLRSVTDGANGVFGDAGSFPTQSWNNSNYFRDVVFEADDAVRINFQPASSPVPAGHLVDSGARFGHRGNGLNYGWNATNNRSRDRNHPASPDKRHDTLNHMQLGSTSAYWEIAVPNGDYRVHVVAGDPAFFGGVYRIAVEDVIAVHGQTTDSQRWLRGTVTVRVGDGRLTIDNAAGSTSNKLAFVEVAPLSPQSGAPLDANEAARFLNQATFGATSSEIARLEQLGLRAWMDEQLALPVSWNHVEKTLETATYAGCHYLRPSEEDLNYSMWGAFRSSPDQLRQRMVYALSQILVTSQVSHLHYEKGLLSPSYVDMLGEHAFGNYRDLLGAMARHPSMGVYLSHLFNAKGNPSTGRIPDQNFARELLQLFSIGLEELNLDGTPILESSGPNAGQPIATYGQDDIEGLAKVMTGWALASHGDDWWHRPGWWCNQAAQTQPMKAFPEQHEPGPKRFLGLTIPAQASPDPEASLDAALDHIFAHPNVGPFIGRQLIQRFVVSNPSPEYVARVATVFNDNGEGVRGDLAAVIEAVLLDPEARDPRMIGEPDWGKIREPILRQAQIMRAFNASTSQPGGGYQLRYRGQNYEFGIGQQPLRSRTVFNFYRPGYVPPGSILELAGLTAPEMQIVDEFRITQWTNTWLMEVALEGGFTGCCSDEARNSYYWRLDYAPLIALLEESPERLVDHFDQLLMAGQMSAELREVLLETIDAQTSGRSEFSGMNRGVAHMKVGRALHHLLASAEYVIQK
ncbi:MAG: DUF1800 family protein [Lysobacteraceae bacterium]